MANRDITVVVRPQEQRGSTSSGSPKMVPRPSLSPAAAAATEGRRPTSASPPLTTDVRSPRSSGTSVNRLVRPSIVDALDDDLYLQSSSSLLPSFSSSPSAAATPARKASVTFSSLFIEDEANDPHKNKPDIIVETQDTKNFVGQMTPERCAKLTQMTIRWHNFTPSYNGIICRLMLAFSAWSFKVHVWKHIEEVRMKRELTKVSKLILHSPPSARTAADITKLVSFHVANMESLKDASGFSTFAAVSRRALQSFYRHAVMKTLPPNTPIFVQGQEAGTHGAHQDRYFILLHGSVSTFVAVKDDRVKDIARSVTHVLEAPFPVPLLTGYLGKALDVLQANVSFGGVQFTDPTRGTWTVSAVTATECEVVVVSSPLYDALLKADHSHKFVLAKRAKDIKSVPAFESLPAQYVASSLAPFFSNVTYANHEVVVTRGDDLSRIVVVLSGVVDLVAHVVDPLDATLSEPPVLLTIAECGPGAIIGDVELSGGKRGAKGKKPIPPMPTFVFGCVAASERVETLEIKMEDFKRLVWEHWQCKAARKDILEGALKKAEFHSLRVGELMLNRAIEGRKAAAEKALLDERRGGVIDMLRRKRKEEESKRKKWEQDHPEKITVPAYPNVIEDLLYPVRDHTSERGFRVVSRYGDRDFVPEKKSERIPNVVVSRAQPAPYEDPTMRGSSRGGSRGALSTPGAGTF